MLREVEIFSCKIEVKIIETWYYISYTGFLARLYLTLAMLEQKNLLPSSPETTLIKCNSEKELRIPGMRNETFLYLVQRSSLEQVPLINKLRGLIHKSMTLSIKQNFRQKHTFYFLMYFRVFLLLANTKVCEGSQNMCLF